MIFPLKFAQLPAQELPSKPVRLLAPPSVNQAVAVSFVESKAVVVTPPEGWLDLEEWSFDDGRKIVAMYRTEPFDEATISHVLSGSGSPGFYDVQEVPKVGETKAGLGALAFSRPKGHDVLVMVEIHGMNLRRDK